MPELDKNGIKAKLYFRQRLFLFLSSRFRHNTFIIVVRGKARAPLLMRLLFGFPNESSSWGLTLKSRGTKEHRRGMQAPGNGATTEKSPRGRQRTEQVVIEHVRYSVALSGLSIVDTFVPGVFTPVCNLSHLRCLFSKQQYTYTFSTFSILLLFLFTFLFFYFFTFLFTFLIFYFFTFSFVVFLRTRRVLTAFFSSCGT